MTQERQDGWYWVRWPERRYPPVRHQPEPWSPAEWCGQERKGHASAHWRANMNLYHSDPEVIGPRIPSPDEPNAAPDLLAVVKAAKMLMSSEAINDSPYVKHSYAAAALRSALAKLEERGS